MKNFVINNELKIPKIDRNIIREIELKIIKKESLLVNEVQYFLDYLVYLTRIKLTDDLKNATFKNLCNRAQCMIHYYLKDLNVNHYMHKTGNSITTGITDHSFLIAKFNVEDEEIPFIIDPTYRQFFESKRVELNHLDPAHFIKEKDKQIIRDFLECGYMCMTEENAKIYGNSFYLTKKNLPEPKLEINGAIFVKIFLKDGGIISKSREDLISENLYITPLVSEEKQPERKI